MSSTIGLIFGFCLGAVTIRGGHGFHNGAPVHACEYMKPDVRHGGVTGDEGHTTQPQNWLPTYGHGKTPPYYIQIDNDALAYAPGQTFQVSVVANQTRGANMFKGLLLMARPVTCATQDTIEVSSVAVGKFSVLSSSVLKTLDCFDAPASAITHSTPQYKINETVTWTAPDQSAGNLVFRATVVQERTVYWMDLHSPILRDSSANPPAQCSSVKVRQRSVVIGVCVALASIIARLL